MFVFDDDYENGKDTQTTRSITKKLGFSQGKNSEREMAKTINDMESFYSDYFVDYKERKFYIPYENNTYLSPLPFYFFESNSNIPMATKILRLQIELCKNPNFRLAHHCVTRAFDTTVVVYILLSFHFCP